MVPGMLFLKSCASSEAVRDDRDKYLAALNQAQNEYEVAMSCFREATDPEIIDEAIFLMQAARKKYSYFLKKVRQTTA